MTCHFNETSLETGHYLAHSACSLTLALVGAVGNASSIWLLWQGRLYNGVTSALLTNLCVADLLIATLILPLLGVNGLHNDWLYGDVFCQVFGYVLSVTLSSEFLIVISITVNQYLTVVWNTALPGPASRSRSRPNSLAFRPAQKVRLALALLAPWLFYATVYALPLAGVTGDRFGFDPRIHMCTLINNTGSMGLKWSLSAGMLLCSVVVIVFCYVSIYCKNQRSQRKTAPKLTQQYHQHKQRQRQTQYHRQQQQQQQQQEYQQLHRHSQQQERHHYQQQQQQQGEMESEETTAPPVTTITRTITIPVAAATSRLDNLALPPLDLRLNPPTYLPTQPPPHPSTQPPTQSPTQPQPHPPTQIPTHPPTQPPPYPPPQPSTHPTTQPPPHPPTQPPPQPPTQPPPQPPQPKHPLTRIKTMMATTMATNPRNAQLIRMISVILLNFGLTYIPFLVMYAADPCLKRVPPPALVAVVYISFSHSATNPLIYAMMNKQLLAQWKDAIRRCFRRHAPSASATPTVVNVIGRRTTMGRV